MRRILAAAIGALAFTLGAADARTFRIEPGPDAAAQFAAAAERAEEGDAIAFAEGRFDLDARVAITADKIEIRGRGPDRTIISFAPLQGEAPAITVLGARTTVSDLTLADSPGPALLLAEGERLRIDRVRITWTAARPGASGMVIEQASNVLVSRARVDAAPAAGMVLRRVRDAAVERSAFDENRVGVMVETSQGVEIREIEARGNGVGVFLISAPGADGARGERARVTGSTFTGGRGLEGALEGDFAGLAPTGVGVAVMGYAQARIDRNAFSMNALAHIMAQAYPGALLTATADPLPQDLSIARNTFGPFATFAPTGMVAGLAAAGQDGLNAQADVLWDGARSFVAAGRPRSGTVRIGFERNATPGRGLIYKGLNLESAGAPASEATIEVLTPLILDIDPPKIDAPG